MNTTDRSGSNITKNQVHGVMHGDQYEQLITVIVPIQPLLLSTIIDYLPTRPQRILELGCGTGILTAMVRKEYPDTEIDAIDLSPEMIEIAAAKPNLEGVRFFQQDLRDKWPENRYDAIITSLCLHHISKEERITVARRAALALSPGGRLICGDIFCASTKWEEEIQQEIWCRSMKREGASNDLITGMIAQREKHMPEFTTFSWFQNMLGDSGFSHAIVPLTSGFVGMVVGMK